MNQFVNNLKMATDTEIEAMSIFGLLDPTNTGELHIKQVNSLLHKFEALGDRNKPEITLEEIPSKASETPVKSSLAMGNSPLFSHRKSVIIKKGVKKVQSDHLIARRESFQSGPTLKKRESHEEYFGRLVDSPKLEKLDKPEKSKFEFNNFPNKKKEIGLTEFTTIYANNFVDHPIQDDILLKCFSTFDYNK